MTDAFAILHLPRRPWLDSNEVRSAFQSAAAAAHPDRGGTEERSAEVSRAYEVLRDPASRLRHWLSLQTPAASIPSIPPPDLMDCFQPVAAQLRLLKEAAQRHATATSALERAGVIAEMRSAQKFLGELNQRREELLAPLKEIGGEASAEVVGQLAATAGKLAFIDKWIAQLREAVLRLQL